MEFFNSLLFIYLKSRTFVSLTVEHLLEFSHFAKWTSTYNRRQNYLSSKKFFAICSVTRHTLARKRNPFSFLHSLRRRKRRPRPLFGGGRLIVVSFEGLFYNYFGTLITGSLLGGGYLMQIQLYALNILGLPPRDKAAMLVVCLWSIKLSLEEFT